MIAGCVGACVGASVGWLVACVVATVLTDADCEPEVCAEYPITKPINNAISIQSQVLLFFFGGIGDCCHTGGDGGRPFVWNGCCGGYEVFGGCCHG